MNNAPQTAAGSPVKRFVPFGLPPGQISIQVFMHVSMMNRGGASNRVINAFGAKWVYREELLEFSYKATLAPIIAVVQRKIVNNHCVRGGRQAGSAGVNRR